MCKYDEHEVEIERLPGHLQVEPLGILGHHCGRVHRLRIDSMKLCFPLLVVGRLSLD